ncbi:MAG: CARDB domain-containing protein, partial [Chitinispirillia bacterium]
WSNSKFEYGYSAVGNFDNDEFAEIVMYAKGYVYLVEHSGEIIWGPVDIYAAEADQDQNQGGIPTIADFNGDLKPEIGIAGKNSYTVLNGDGSVKWKTPVPYQSINITGTSVFDFEGDGTAEVIYFDEENLKICHGSDGYILNEYKLTSGIRFESPLIIDVDNDQNAEIVAVNNSSASDGPSGIIVIGDANQTWVNTRKIWNQRVYSLTNIEENGSIPANPDASWLTHNTFRYNISKDALTCVDVTSSYVRKKESKFIVRIGNGGTVNISSGLNVAYYNGNPNNGGKLLGVRYTTKQLNPGQYEDVTLTSVPALKPGQYGLYIVADDNGKGKGQYREINENNNKIYIRFSVELDGFTRLTNM